MYICIYVYICICIYIYICKYIYIHICIYIYTYIHIGRERYVYIDTYKHAQTHTHIYIYTQLVYDSPLDEHTTHPWRKRAPVTKRSPFFFERLPRTIPLGSPVVRGWDSSQDNRWQTANAHGSEQSWAATFSPTSFEKVKKCCIAMMEARHGPLRHTFHIRVVTLSRDISGPTYRYLSICTSAYLLPSLLVNDRRFYTHTIWRRYSLCAPRGWTTCLTERALCELRRWRRRAGRFRSGTKRELEARHAKRRARIKKVWKILGCKKIPTRCRWVMQVLKLQQHVAGTWAPQLKPSFSNQACRGWKKLWHGRARTGYRVWWLMPWTIVFAASSWPMAGLWLDDNTILFKGFRRRNAWRDWRNHH